MWYLRTFDANQVLSRIRTFLGLFCPDFYSELRILLRFCADICPKNWQLRPLVQLLILDIVSSPIWIQVIIKANPPSLLSTVQFVDNFYRQVYSFHSKYWSENPFSLFPENILRAYQLYRDRLCGEECYWWMQFVGAVEFIKTMEWSYHSDLICHGFIKTIDHGTWSSSRRS